MAKWQRQGIISSRQGHVADGDGCARHDRQTDLGEFQGCVSQKVKVDESTDQSMAYDETTKRQRLPGKLHVMDYKHNLIRAKVFPDEAQLDACERIDAIQAFIGTIPNKNPKFLEKEIGQGNDARRTLVRAQTTDQLKTLKQHFDKFILIDDYLRKQAQALGVESHLVKKSVNGAEVISKTHQQR